jgi:hypothetical protein
VIHYERGDETKASSYSCVSDDKDFAADVEQEQKNLFFDATIGDLANRPN